MVEGRANRNRLDADFGRFGTVSMKFTDTRHLVGTLRGHLRFRGEGGFIDVSTDRVQARITHTFRRVCGPLPSEGEGGGDGVVGVAAPHPHGNRLARAWRLASHPAALLAKQSFRGAQLSVRSSSQGRRLSLQAFESEPSMLSMVLAEEVERVGRVAIARFAFALPKHNPLRLSDPGAKTVTGLLKGPRPFEGSAEYVKSPHTRPTWEGSLRVSLPGLKALPLTGPGFHADLCISENLQQIQRCSKLIK